jgi:hypothetical protein
MPGITTRQALQLIKLAVHARHAEHELGWHEALLHAEWHEEGGRRAIVRLVSRRRKSAEVAAQRLTAYIQTLIDEDRQ